MICTSLSAETMEASKLCQVQARQRGKHFIPSKGNAVSQRLLHKLRRNIQNVGHFHEGLVEAPLSVLKHSEKAVLYLEGVIIYPPMDGHTSRPLFQSFRGQLSNANEQTNEPLTILLWLLPFMEGKKKPLKR